MDAVCAEAGIDTPNRGLTIEGRQGRCGACGGVSVDLYDIGLCFL